MSLDKMIAEITKHTDDFFDAYIKKSDAVEIIRKHTPQPDSPYATPYKAGIYGTEYNQFSPLFEQPDALVTEGEFKMAFQYIINNAPVSMKDIDAACKYVLEHRDDANKPDALVEENKRLIRALMPFVDYLETIEDVRGFSTHDNVELWQNPNRKVTISFGDLRAAKQALSAKQPEYTPAMTHADEALGAIANKQPTNPVVKESLIVDNQPISNFMKKNEGDWPEDFTQENGNYTCRCIDCGKEFTGYKRRIVCKLCDKSPANKTDNSVEDNNSYAKILLNSIQKLMNKFSLNSHEYSELCYIYHHASLVIDRVGEEGELEEVETDNNVEDIFINIETASSVRLIDTPPFYTADNSVGRDEKELKIIMDNAVRESFRAAIHESWKYGKLEGESRERKSDMFTNAAYADVLLPKITDAAFEAIRPYLATAKPAAAYTRSELAGMVEYPILRNYGFMIEEGNECAGEIIDNLISAGVLHVNEGESA